MTSGRRLVGFVLARFAHLGLVAGLAIGVASCSDKTGSDKFVGTWTYSGAINPNCSGSNVAPVDLTGDAVVITASDSSHISMALGTLCMINFDVDGTTATAAANQTCMFDVPGFGAVTASITKWTLMVTGDTITSDVTSTAVICTPSGTGTLTRQSGDAGAGQ
jgi:hypothetical protein